MSLKSGEESKIKEIDEKFKNDTEEINHLLESERKEKIEVKKLLTQFSNGLKDFDKYILYETGKTKESYETYLNNIIDTSEEIEIIDSTIEKLSKFKEENERKRNISISNIKNSLNKKEKETSEASTTLDILNKEYNRVDAEIRKENKDYNKSKSQSLINLYTKNLKDIQGSLWELETELASLISYQNKLQEEKTALDKENQEIDKQLEKLNEKAEAISELEEEYEEEILSLEKKAYASEKLLVSYKDKIEEALKNLK
ncbi:Hypothetical protein MAU_0010 [Metamycoplasma auris 15026]|uniref:Uncharacterized protein n=2 Tax=Metamycoplasma auris TaxID=51363 RepID=N9TT09_9BACT|nr:Hypothetical protein MAU_0010 [Metamycoplasma auris 15026]